MNKFEKTLKFISEKIQPDSPFYKLIYLVGGCVRDEILGQRYTDLDLLIDMPDGQRKFVEYMCATFPETCKGPFYYQRYGTTAMDVIIDSGLTLVECVEPHVEEYADDGVTLLQTRFCTLEEDAQRRDYTCNALYKNLHTHEILDPTGRGQSDLKNGLLCTPLDPQTIYKQDPVRMLRGIRFKHQKGFHLDDEAWQAIITQHDEMAKAAPKRLHDELNKIMKTATLGEAIDDLYRCGLLGYVMPGFSVDLLDQMEAPYLTEGITAWRHTCLALKTLVREHQHTDSVNRLVILLFHTAESKGTKEVEEVLQQCQIGRERKNSIIHLLMMYQRFSSFYKEGKFIGKPRTLPHFIQGLGNSVNEFRRIVRALNVGMKEECKLPYNVFYIAQSASPKASTPSTPRRRRETIEPEMPRNRKRNKKRSEQRKRARQRKRAGQADTQQAAPAAASSEKDTKGKCAS